MDEVKQKLNEFDLPASDYDSIIDELKKEKFIDEKRYAESFARGKFKIKKWGKHKIKASLVSKKIEPNLIKSALLLIDEKEYIETLKLLVDKKRKEINTKDAEQAKLKVARFVLSKGYEHDLVWDIVNKK